jgi:hypothetical protein
MFAYKSGWTIEELLTQEEQAVFRAVVNGVVDKIEDGTKQGINRMLNISRLSRMR